MESKTKKMLPSNQLRALINESSIDAEARTVELVWSTGSKGLRQGWEGRYYEELSMDPSAVDLSRLNSGAPLLDSHNSMSNDGVIGVVERAQTDGKQGTALVRFAKDEKSDAIFKKVQDKILRNVSVGYQVFKYEDVSDKNDSIRTYRAVNWQPAEISIVPVGFDPAAQIREQELKQNEVEIITRSQQQKETEMSEVKTQPPVQNIDAEALKKEAIEAERKRASEIRTATRNAGLQETLAEDMIERGLPLDEARKNIEAFKKAIEASNKIEVKSEVRVEVGTDEREKKREAAVNAVLHRIDPKNFKPEQGNPFTGLSMLRMMEAFEKRRPGMYDVELAQRVMSSSDLPYILANSGEKAAQKKYQLQPQSFSRWAKSETLRNFKTADRVRSGDFSSLLEIKEGGEVKQGSLGEEREQVALKEWGIKMAFTRRMLINDDLSELAKVIAQAGVAASRLENRLVYEVLTSNPTMGDGIALFHSSHANLGTGGAISDTTIGEAFQKMREQTSVDGLDVLNLIPQFMICGPQSEALARKYLSVISPTQASNVNPFSSSLELIVDAQISTNDYFFACSPDACPTVVLYKLEGQESPRVESRIDFDTNSLEIKCQHDCNAAAADFRGLVKNANAS